MKYELTGRIIAINETQTFASGFQKREFIVEEIEGKYPQVIKFEVVKEGCERLDAYRIGQEVTVSFNLRGNEYNGKHYVALLAWRITDTQAARSSSKASPATRQPNARPTSQNGARPPETDDDDDGDDLPF